MKLIPAVLKDQALKKEIEATRCGDGVAIWPLGMTDGDSRHIGKMHVHAVPAAHNAIDRDSLGRCHHLGYIVRLGEITIYHSGDTMLYPAMADLLKPMAIDLAILPINGYRPQRRVSGNLFGDEAAELARQIGARMVLPCHYDMFTFNTESPELFASTCRSIDQPYRVLRCAERLLFN